jgi:ABC-type nitrate/sulfonate/bicarbonate transport system substrate-binding protein
MMKRILAIISLMLVVVMFGAGLSSCSNGSYTGEEGTINFGANTSGSCGLIYIAQERGYFADQGLTVNIKDYDSGSAAIDAVLNGDVDIAWSSEFRLVRGAFAKERINALAVINTFTDQFIFGRTDSGIKNISDLAGKKIGVPRNTITEFYLTLFLMFNGINISDVSLSDVLPSQAMEALSSGKVDAAVVWEPYSSQMKMQFADTAISWSVQKAQPGFGVISSRNDWITENPQTVVPFLKALVQAEDYLIRNTQTARRIIQTRLQYDDAAMETVWSECQFSFSLDQSLILAMEDEARWMISNNLTSEKMIPNFLSYIYTDAMKTARPSAVKIVGK